MRDCRPWARCTAWGGWSTWRAGLKTKHQQPFNYVQYNPEIVVRAKLNLINYLQQKSEIVVMAQLKPFNNSRQNYVIAVMAKLQHFKYFTSIHELSSWQGFFYFWHIPGTDSKILPQYMNYHHDTRFFYFCYFPGTDSKWRCARTMWERLLSHLERARWKILKTFENVTVVNCLELHSSE